jgi:hypothetical protein
MHQYTPLHDAVDNDLILLSLATDDASLSSSMPSTSNTLFDRRYPTAGGATDGDRDGDGAIVPSNRETHQWWWCVLQALTYACSTPRFIYI